MSSVTVAPETPRRRWPSTWIARLEEGSRKTYWISYAVFFVLMFACMSGYLFATGQSFIWYDDGLTQQYTTFVQQGEWLRSLFAHVFAGSSDFSLWNDDLGYGQDMLLALNFSLGNPINLLSMLADAHNAGFVLNLTVPITLALAGVTFSLFAFSRTDDGLAVLVGCLVFVFSGYSFVAGRQIYMLYPLVLAPLLFWGADRVFERTSPVLLIVTSLLFFLLRVDMVYQACLLLLVYCLVKFFLLPEKKTVRSFFGWVARIFGCVFLGFCMGAVLFVPQAAAILTQERLSAARSDALLYPLRYYLHTFVGFLGGSLVGSECYWGYAPVALVGVSSVFFMKRSRTKRLLVILFVIGTASVFLPVVGRLANGMAYASNRWVWGYSLLVGYMTVVAFPELASFDRGQRSKVVWAVALYGALAFVPALVWHTPTFFIALAVLVVLLVMLVRFGGQSTAWKMAVLCSLLATCFTSYSWMLGMGKLEINFKHAPLLADYYDLAVSGMADSLAADIPEGDGGRYDVVGNATSWRNVGFMTGRNSVSFYNSVYNDAIDSYHRALGLATSPFDHSYASLDSRTTMEQFAGVDYLVAKQDEASAYVPPLYYDLVSTRQLSDGTYGLYRAQSTLPLAFTYEETTSESSVKALAPKDAEYALLDAMALEDDRCDDASSDPGGTVAAAGYSTTLDYQATIGGGCRLDEDLNGSSAGKTYSCGEALHVGASQVGSVYLDVTIPANTQAFVTLEHVSFDLPTMSDNYSPDELEAMSSTERAWRELRLAASEPSQYARVTATCGSVQRTVDQPLPNSSLYGGKDTWVVDLGLCDTDRRGITLSLPTNGTYRIGNIAVTTENSDAVDSSLERLASHGAQDVIFSSDVVSCTAEGGDDARWLFFRLPYSNGWHAEVDGEPCELCRADIGFAAVPLDEGTHQVTLTYETPGLREGAWTSLAGLVAFVVLVAVRRIRKARASRRDSSPWRGEAS